MSNSKLVDIVKLSPNHYDGRTHKIDTITIHCMAGQLSAVTCGNVFAPVSRQASSNYGVGYDGKIGMYVEEKNAPWTTSSYSNDNRAITIEVASDTFAPYKVNAKAYKSLIKLLVDICKRNGIKELKWKADKSLIGQVDKQNMTAHRWFANTACPGDYLYNRFGDIAKKVNKQLSKNKKVKLISNAGLYKSNWSDPVGGASKPYKTLKRGTTVKVLSDDGHGWLKVKVGLKTGWITSSHISTSHGYSKYDTINVSKGTRVRRLNTAKTKFETDTKLGASHKFVVVCTITSGKYKGCRYAKLISKDQNDGKYYYIF